MLPKEMLNNAANVIGRDWNDLLRRLKRFFNIRSGPGITIKDLPGALTISADMQYIRGAGAAGSQTQLARVWPCGPPPENITGLPGIFYYVREISLYVDGTSSHFGLKQNGFWELAVNIAEWHLLPVYSDWSRLLHKIADTSEDPVEWHEFNASGETDIGIKTPIVPTWKVSGIDPSGTAATLRMFSLLQPIFSIDDVREFHNEGAYPGAGDGRWRGRDRLNGEYW